MALRPVPARTDGIAPASFANSPQSRPLRAVIFNVSYDADGRVAAIKKFDIDIDIESDSDSGKVNVRETPDSSLKPQTSSLQPQAFSSPALPIRKRTHDLAFRSRTPSARSSPSCAPFTTAWSSKSGAAAFNGCRFLPGRHDPPPDP